VSSVISFDKSMYSHRRIFSTNFVGRGGIPSDTITRGDDVDENSEDSKEDLSGSAEELHTD